jgi:CheY-like chemotaxis protein
MPSFPYEVNRAVHQPISVLLVEDNPGDSTVIRGLLQTAGTDLAVTHVTTLSNALERLKNSHVDVILLDLGLPDSWGLETLARIRTQGPGVPVIVITGADEKELAIRARLQGAQDFYAKEYLDKDLLIRAIQRVSAH